MSWDQIKGVILRVAAWPTSAPASLTNAAWVATVSVAHALAQLWKLGLADDLRNLRDDGLKRVQARTNMEVAKARKAMAEAIEAENKAALVKRNDRIAKAEEQKLLAEAAKASAEAHAIYLRSHTDLKNAQTAAFVSVFKAMSRINERGGKVAIDPENLARIIGLKSADALSEAIRQCSPDFPPSTDHLAPLKEDGESDDDAQMEA